MDPGALAFAAIACTAALLLFLSFARARTNARRVLAAGFVACDAEAPALLAALLDIAGGHPPAPRRKYEIGRCFKRPGGHGMVYRLAVTDVTNARDDSSADRVATGGRFDVYLVDLPDPERIAQGPVSVFLAPPAPGALHKLLAALVKSDPHGVALELPDAPRARHFLAAFADRPGKLDLRLAADAQERLAKAGALGFFAAHFGAGKLALTLQPERADVERELAYLAEWV